MSTPIVRRVVSLGLLAVAAAGCGGSPTAPTATAQTLPAIGETANYVLRASEGDTINAEWQERYHAWATATLNVTPRQKIRYNSTPAAGTCRR